MKTILQSMAIAILFAGCAQQGVIAPPFDLPPGVTYETEDDVELHSFRWGTNSTTTALFMIYPHPAGLNQAMVESMVETSKMTGGYMMCIGNHIPFNVTPEGIKRYIEYSRELAHR